MPLVPPLTLCAARGLHLLARTGWRGVLVRTAGCIVLALALGLHAWNSIPGLSAGTELVDHWTDLGKSLANTFTPETRLAVPAVGIIPFYSGLYVIDMLGLNERTIASRPPDLTYYYPGHNRHDGSYVLDLEPDLIILGKGPTVPDKSITEFPWYVLPIFESDVISDPRFVDRYMIMNMTMQSGRYVQIFASKKFLERRRANKMR
jgi:hypothetical protein